MSVVDTRHAIAEERKALGLGGLQQANALCLSGGGIRSAAFGLGVVQGLAQAGLLKRFHYLSTVSGGGYIGGWLTRLITSANETTEPETKVDLDSIEKRLANRKDGFEIPELRALRRYTRYLAPSLGPLSADLWAGIVLWIRNTLINWLVFTPLFVAVALLPVLYAMLIAVLGWLRPYGPFVAHGPLALTPPVTLAALATFAIAITAPVTFGVMIYRSFVELPSHSLPAVMEPPLRKEDYGKPGRVLNRYIVRWALVWAFLAPLAVIPILHMTPSVIASDVEAIFGSTSATKERANRETPTIVSAELCKAVVTVGGFCVSKPMSENVLAPPHVGLWLIALPVSVTFVTGMVAYFAAWRRVAKFDYSKNPKGYRDKQLKPFKTNIGAWTWGCMLSASLNGLGLYIGIGLGPISIALAGPLWIVVAEILRSTLYIALRRDALRGDLDREWSARLNGAKLSWVLVYSVLAVLVLVAPDFIATSTSSWIVIASGGAASGTMAALLGKSAMTLLAARASDGSALVGTRVLINAAILLFGTSLVLIAGRCSIILADMLGRLIEPFIRSRMPPAVSDELAQGTILLAALAMVAYVSWLLPNFLGHRINLNNFSMHAVYRNRLVRAFLGTARSPDRWRPDQYTHFDPRDDVRMASAFDNRFPKSLYPVVNVALNRTSGKDMARAERKAMPFTITPHRCGFSNPTEANLRAGSYAATRDYAGNEREFGPADEPNGISLGTAIAL
jgi:hypothetical protein